MGIEREWLDASLLNPLFVARASAPKCEPERGLFVVTILSIRIGSIYQCWFLDKLSSNLEKEFRESIKAFNSWDLRSIYGKFSLIH